MNWKVVRVSEALWQQLQARKDATGVPVATIVRQACEMYLAVEAQQAKRRKAPSPVTETEQPPPALAPQPAPSLASTLNPPTRRYCPRCAHRHPPYGPCGCECHATC